VGFFLGFELKPTVYFAWFYGVVPEFRRQGVASQLMDAVHAWARDNDYNSIRFECHNQHRPMLHLAIALGYDIVGIRWDPDRGDNLVLFEKGLNT
jgi:GNAT superfamily N-acetyltransferase